MVVPETGTIYSVNEGNYMHFSDGVKNYIKFCQEEDAVANRPYTARYTGSMVADLHRSLIKGGIYMYPLTSQARQGKLRLVYECNPMAFIVEQAGGKASDGFVRIMNKDVLEIHQRSAIFIGSSNMVAKLEYFLALENK